MLHLIQIENPNANLILIAFDLKTKCYHKPLLCYVIVLPMYFIDTYVSICIYVCVCYVCSTTNSDYAKIGKTNLSTGAYFEFVQVRYNLGML